MNGKDDGTGDKFKVVEVFTSGSGDGSEGPEDNLDELRGMSDALGEMAGEAGSDDEQTEDFEELSAHSFATLVAANIEAKKVAEEEEARKKEKAKAEVEEERQRRIQLVAKEAIGALQTQLSASIKAVRQHQQILDDGDVLAKLTLKTDEQGNITQAGSVYCNQDSIEELSRAVEEHFRTKEFKIESEIKLKVGLFEINFLITY